MHLEAFNWVENSFHKWHTDNEIISVLEFGSLDINGSVKNIFKQYCSSYIGVDMQEGPGVDVVSDAKDFDSPELFDVVVCCEVFEHTPVWKEIISNSHRLLRSGGLFVATMAGEGRAPHSAIDENPIRDWEYYGNIGEWELNRCLSGLFSVCNVDYRNFDLRCYAVK